ncbi:unnamed protein product [Paramecium sonneborni]|uniref:Uncharacterized protein n=1 Tax=Paramecium sonneborni TaxID=65129 RepID=A0A8S1RNG9_9CILI|nr:unnamed protein product [Paramecium sonneborni]
MTSILEKHDTQEIMKININTKQFYLKDQMGKAIIHHLLTVIDGYHYRANNNTMISLINRVNVITGMERRNFEQLKMSSDNQQFFVGLIEKSYINPVRFQLHCLIQLNSEVLNNKFYYDFNLSFC